MSESSGGLAKVTYLFGAEPPLEPIPAVEPVPAVEPDDAVEPIDRRGSTEPVESIEPAEVAIEIDEADERRRAENISMHALTRRGVSSSELRTLLRSRELAPEVVEYEIERLERVALLDDAALADTLVRTLHERKGLGRAALSAELKRRGIEASTVSAALDAVDGDDELARATELARKRAPQLRSLDAETAKRRLSAFLMRKGYQGSVVSSAVSSALSGSTGGPTFR